MGRIECFVITFGKKTLFYWSYMVIIAIMVVVIEIIKIP